MLPPKRKAAVNNDRAAKNFENLAVYWRLTDVFDVLSSNQAAGFAQYARLWSPQS